MCNCPFDTLISTPLSVQQAVPSSNAETANVLRALCPNPGVTPSSSIAAFLVNSISRCDTFHLSASKTKSLTSPIFWLSINTLLFARSLNFKTGHQSLKRENKIYYLRLVAPNTWYRIFFLMISKNRV